MSPDERSLLALTRVLEPGSRAVHRALTSATPTEVWQAVRRGAVVPGLGQPARERATARAAGVDPDAEEAVLVAAGARLVTAGAPEWPADRLAWGGEPVDAPPLWLFARGPARLDRVLELSVSVVGARACTAYGAQVARDLGYRLAELGVTVVSGAAYGIDRAAHAGALDAPGGAPTLAVLACGVDVAYPGGNRGLLERIAAEGLVLSEWPPGSHPTRSRFLVRNRVIAALTLGTVVVEAAGRSGSLSTMSRARELRRHVMAVPGPVTSVLSAGCHEQLRHAEPATCVTRAEEVVDLVGRLGGSPLGRATVAASRRDGLAQVARQVLDAVPVRRPAGEAGIARSAGVGTLEVQQVLPALLVAGLVERCGDGWRLTSLGIAP